MTTTFPSSSDGSEDTREGRPSQSTLCCKYPVNKSSLVLTRAVGGGSYLHSVTAGDLTERVNTGGAGQTSTDHIEHLALRTALALRWRTFAGNLSFPLSPSEGSPEVPSKIVLLTLSEKTVLLVV